MENAAEFVNGLRFAGLHEVDGECFEHGPSRTLVRRIEGWHCRKCLEVEVAAKVRAEWLAERNGMLLKIAHIPEKFMGRRWPTSTLEQQHLRGTVRQFRDFIVGRREWAALVMSGKTGTGKTWLASELAEAMIRNLSMSVRYVTAQGIVSEIQASYRMEGRTEEGEIDRFVQYDLLVIDEADVKRDNANAALLFTEVINRRYLGGKPVVMITNQSMENLEQYVGDRVYSRLHENGFVCAFSGPDLRRSTT